MARERHQSAVLNASASVKATHFHWGPSARLITMLAVLSSSDMLTFTLNLYLEVSSLSQILTQNTPPTYVQQRHPAFETDKYAIYFDICSCNSIQGIRTWITNLK